LRRRIHFSRVCRILHWGWNQKVAYCTILTTTKWCGRKKEWHSGGDGKEYAQGKGVVWLVLG
jgi:hypothetical protein